jgi:transcriptional regulator with XRE-family HTH domain
MDNEQFTVLENKTIGRNISMFRKVREKKAAEVADFIGISETAYTKYERGETQITIEFLQKAANALKVDPLMLLSTSPGHFIESISNSPNAGIGNYVGGDFKMPDEDQTQLLIKLVENVMAMNDKIMAILEKK